MKALSVLKPTAHNRRSYLILCAFVIFSGFVWLALSLLDENINYFKTLSSLTVADRQAGKSTRLGGIVVMGSINQRERGIVFVLTDGTLREKIHFNGVLPDLFRDGQGVVVDGHFDINGIFIASRILAKHDENYMSRAIPEKCEADKNQELRKTQELEQRERSKNRDFCSNEQAYRLQSNVP